MDLMKFIGQDYGIYRTGLQFLFFYKKKIIIVVLSNKLHIPFQLIYIYIYIYIYVVDDDDEVNDGFFC